MADFTKILSGLAELIRPLIAFFLYLAGKRAQRTETEAEQAKVDAELANDYLENRSGNTSPGDTLKRMQDGSF